MKPPILPPLEKCSPTDRTTMMRTRAILVQRLEDQPQLIALRHRNDVVGRPVEDDVGALMRLVDFDLETVELAEPGIGEIRRVRTCSFLSVDIVRPRLRAARVRAAYSPATSRRRSSFPTGDFGMASTKTKRRGRLKFASPEVRQNCSSSLLGDGALALDERGDDLAPFLVGEADDGDLEHGRVQRQAAFDLDRRDVLAAGDDHVVDAPGDEQIAVAIDEAGVAGEIPALAQRLGVGVGPAPVTLEGLIAGQARDDLALLVGRGKLRDRFGVRA